MNKNIEQPNRQQTGVEPYSNQTHRATLTYGGGRCALAAVASGLVDLTLAGKLNQAAGEGRFDLWLVSFAKSWLSK